MAGNRDFLVGAGAARACGVRPLPDPTLARAGGKRVLLTHGDALCLADVAYQTFRLQVRSAEVAARFPGAAAGRAAARRGQLRHARSRAGTRRRRPAALTSADVDIDGGCGGLHARAGATRMVHGHTHRPGDRALAPGFERHGAERLGSRRGARRAPRCCGCTRGGFERGCAWPTPADVPLMRRWWQRLARAARACERRAIPDALWRATLARYPSCGRRSAADVDRTAAPDQPVPRPQGVQRRARPGGHRRDGGGDRRAGLPAGAATWASTRYDGFVGIVVHADEVRGAARGHRRRRRRARVRRSAVRRSDGRRPGDAVVARRARAPASRRAAATTW